MALIFVDGFESFGTTAAAAPVGLFNKWGPISGDHDSDTIQVGRFNDGFCLRPSSNENTFNATVTPIFAQATTVVAGVAFRIDALPAGGQFRDLISFDTTSGTECGVAVTSTGALRVYRSSPSTNIEESSSGLIVADTWYYLEFKATIANSGSYDVHLDGVQVVDGAGDTQTSNAWCDRVRLIGRSTTSGNTTQPDFDDFYCLDTTGSPSDFLGPRHVYTLFPTGAGDDTDLTPNTGANYAAVDDNGIDSDTTYIESSVEDAQDLYQFQDTTLALDITAVVVYGIAKKTDITSFDFIAMAKSGGIEGAADPALVDSQTYHAVAGVLLVDPDTASPWDAAGISAAQFGLKVGY